MNAEEECSDGLGEPDGSARIEDIDGSAIMEAIDGKVINGATVEGEVICPSEV